MNRLALGFLLGVGSTLGALVLMLRHMPDVLAREHHT